MDELNQRYLAKMYLSDEEIDAMKQSVENAKTAVELAAVQYEGMKKMEILVERSLLSPLEALPGKTLNNLFDVLFYVERIYKFDTANLRTRIYRQIYDTMLMTGAYPRFAYNSGRIRRYLELLTPSEGIDYLNTLLNDREVADAKTRDSLRQWMKKELERLRLLNIRAPQGSVGLHRTLELRPRTPTSEATPKTSNSNIKPIEWLKSDGSLMYLFNLLHKAGYISDTIFHDRARILSEHFEGTGNKAYTKKDLQSAESNYKNNKTEKPRDAWQTEAIVKRLNEFSLENP